MIGEVRRCCGGGEVVDLVGCYSYSNEGGGKCGSRPSRDTSSYVLFY
jgi:hypothetical protein